MQRYCTIFILNTKSEKWEYSHQYIMAIPYSIILCITLKHHKDSIKLDRISMLYSFIGAMTSKILRADLIDFKILNRLLK